MPIHSLLNKDINCACGKTHRCNISTVEIYNGALEKLPTATDKYNNILLVADSNTYPLCEKQIKEMLSKRIESECIFNTSGVLVPDESAIKQIKTFLTPNTDFILGIGSGVINDLCKYVSFYHGIKSGIIATAPSMDGYASSGAAMIINGMKVTDITHAPDIIIGDTEILKNAPIDMIRSGYGDIIGKYSSLCDWKLANLILGEHICKPIYNLVLETTNEIRNSADLIISRDDKAIEKLMRALVLIGMTLTLVETTRPGSGSEHHLSHFYEIGGLINGEKHFPHGTDVAYNTVLTAAMREQICKLSLPQFCEETKEERESSWKRIYSNISTEVEQLQKATKNYNKNLSPIYTEKWEDIKSILAECPTAKELNDIFETVGFNFSEYENLYGYNKILDTMFYGKGLKNRYSVLWLYYTLFSGKP